ncbi:uncharacterized protein I206_101610 [Kwoniella pini CBS 10737]|uniref:Uncharacterized protein n=1 Tax=Kwoniella pini CBS 10737 TaxID=1296096 RepID=A0A1B9HW87_9TREE|nr:uncharacterized protein I206_06420 [Kwoniella pini CBS 10737]OCF47519.1 hypothetical protein I206_06420 [Kwoniella pini CBS 10737]
MPLQSTCSSFSQSENSDSGDTNLVESPESEYANVFENDSLQKKSRTLRRTRSLSDLHEYDPEEYAEDAHFTISPGILRRHTTTLADINGVLSDEDLPDDSENDHEVHQNDKSAELSTDYSRLDHSTLHHSGYDHTVNNVNGNCDISTINTYGDLTQYTMPMSHVEQQPFYPCIVSSYPQKFSSRIQYQYAQNVRSNYSPDYHVPQIQWAYQDPLENQIDQLHTDIIEDDIADQRAMHGLPSLSYPVIPKCFSNHHSCCQPSPEHTSMIQYMYQLQWKVKLEAMVAKREAKQQRKSRS